MPEKNQSCVGVRFTETMRGYMSTIAGLDYDDAELTGRHAGTPLAFTVTVTFDDITAAIIDPLHAGRIEGSVDAPALAPRPLKVEGGDFHLFERDSSESSTYLMRYRMPMQTEDGRRLVLHGLKTLRDDLGVDMWRDMTTLAVDIEDPDGRAAGRGVVYISIHDFARQLATMEAVSARSRTEALWVLSRFGIFFEEKLREIYGGTIAPIEPLPKTSPQRRPLRCGEGQRIPITTEDGVELRLTRFKGGTKGPVLLTPGFGTSTFAYTLDTVDTNLPEFLYERGYDVWLLDYRSSPDLVSASTQFTLDDIARYDYPAAIGTVRAQTGANTIQVMAHCVGSLTFQMGQTLGLEGVRSAICSQLTLHPRPPALTNIKSGLYLAELIKGAGLDSFTTNFDDDWADRTLDFVMRLYPSRYQDSASPVLRRILFMYGDVIKLEKLNRATYEAVPAMFGVANLTTFVHLGRIMRIGHAVGSGGDERYLPHADRLALPIAFLHGADNNLFLPEGSAETMRVLTDRNGPDWYTRHVIPDYAHMDCFIGKDAHRDVYPIVAAELDHHN
jgi:choline dehydrogenase-like flavoprotein